LPCSTSSACDQDPHAAGRLPDQELRADVLHEAELLALLADGAAPPLVRARTPVHCFAEPYTVYAGSSVMGRAELSAVRCRVGYGSGPL